MPWKTRVLVGAFFLLILVICWWVIRVRQQSPNLPPTNRSASPSTDLQNELTRIMSRQDARETARELVGASKQKELIGNRSEALDAALNCMQLGIDESGSSFLGFLHGEAIIELGRKRLKELLGKMDSNQCLRAVQELDRMIKSRKAPDFEREKPSYFKVRDAVLMVKEFLLRDRLLQVAISLRGHKLNHGSYPRELKELVPSFLSQVAADPFGGGSLLYQRKKDSFLLYSRGYDGIDDGGRPAPKFDPSTGKVPQGDLVWDDKAN